MKKIFGAKKHRSENENTGFTISKLKKSYFNKISDKAYDLPFEYFKNSEKFILSKLLDEKNDIDDIIPHVPFLKDMCFVEKFAFCILKYFYKSDYSFNSDGVLEDCFYHKCTAIFKEAFNDKTDKDLLIIYAKQIIMMFKKSSIISLSNKTNKIEKSKIKEILFKIFWNEIDWSTLFPSMPSFAENMQLNNGLIKDLLFEREEPFLIDDFVKDYLIITELRINSLLLKISFFDFSIFSWLCNFGILRYVSFPENSNLYFEFTEEGKFFFNKNV